MSSVHRRANSDIPTYPPHCVECFPESWDAGLDEGSLNRLDEVNDASREGESFKVADNAGNEWEVDGEFVFVVLAIGAPFVS